ncbi:cupin domain-containing protein [Alteromonas lipolytica]|uniref:Cupin type-2 domain-containing protein n=1 Tax=Alteromonas lipolytica TaxID=1856405 RepID=A0A1E8FHS2_9ALTE|nr:cupin domain-containing protein [Alteromonas lipolytica]OFI35459.1 hypothetical protein BFC17_11880 [Alteromonas lipolytica]GGF76443.1 hypothetical protein GCM10011338_30770 [Alteromonas lipolytica]
MHKAIILRDTVPTESIDILGGVINVMSDAGQGDEQSVTVQESEKSGFGPPPHSHPWSETFYVISGSVDFMLNENGYHFEAGAMVYIPEHQVHAFQSGVNGVKMIEFTGPGSQALDLFRSLSTFLKNSSPEELDRVHQIFSQHGATLCI